MREIENLGNLPIVPNSRLDGLFLESNRLGKGCYLCFFRIVPIRDVGRKLRALLLYMIVAIAVQFRGKLALLA